MHHLERVLYESGPKVLADMARRIQGAAASISAAAARVPEAWWDEGKVNPEALGRCLQERAARTREILQLEHWENVSHATAGGSLFPL